MIQLLTELRPLVADVIPSRKVISERLIPQRAKEEREWSILQLKKEASKGVVIGRTIFNVGMMTDGYKNVSSDHIMAIVIRGNEERLLFDSVEEGSSHDAICIAK